MFADEEFWGPESEYDDPSEYITIRSGSTVGGLDASIDSFSLNHDKTILLTIMIGETFNFRETDDGSAYDNGKLDFGPEVGSTGNYYGDHGFHPTLPKFALQSVE